MLRDRATRPRPTSPRCVSSTVPRGSPGWSWSGWCGPASVRAAPPTPPRCAPRSGRHCPVALDPSSPARSAARRLPRSPWSPVARSSSPARRSGSRRAASPPPPPTPRRCTASRAARASPSRPRAADPDRAAAARARPAALPRDGAVASTASARTGAAPCAPPPPSRSASTPGSAPPSPHRWAAVHALGPVLLAAFANSPAPARAAHRVEVLAAGPCGCALDPARTAPPADPDPGRPGGGLGAPRARRPGAVRAAATASWLVPERRHVRRLGRAARCTPPPTDRRRPRLPRVHAVPPGAPARPPGGALRRHAARAGGGRCPPPCSRRCCPTRA